MEAAGLAFGVAGVTGIVTSCITIWEYISTARHTPEDLKYFLGQVYLETFSFFSWCQLTGLWDNVLEAQSGAGTADLLAPLKEDLAFSKDANLESAKKLLQDYGVIGMPRKRNGLEKRNPLEKFSETSQSIQSAAVKERRKSEGIIDRLRASNKGLRTMLEMVDHPRAPELWRSLQIGAPIPILSRAVIESPALQPSAEPLTEQESTLVAIGRLSERERQVLQPGAGWAALEVDTSPYLKENDFSLHEDKTPTLERFLVPPCLGFFHSKSHSRYGIVFQTKNGGQVPKTLYDRLMEDHRDKSLIGRDLGARLHLSRQLLISMFRFFTVGWIHKNARSSSFAFLDPDPERL
ncbi:prion-inhibition propagation domain-containing protein [Fusarium mundagurra]|uniref:Prion-inhibition propagation domain-containing protein n=1 Tax=Fusarium mundagurra TaxID=1567541 RepID=A0A8H5XM20_9HYPO|nr:prion-inhibition propagation domain-containing protein [Fusarium mundagurra]